MTLLKEINELLKEEHGNPITEIDRLVDSGIDSFGLTMVLLTLDQKYNLYTKEEFSKLDFENILAQDIIDRIQEVSNGN